MANDAHAAKMTLKRALHAFAQEAYGRLATAGGSGTSRRRFVQLDPAFDEMFIDLHSHAAAIDALEALPWVAQQYTSGAASRITQQFVYTLWEQSPTATVERAAFDSLWSRLWTELTTGTWCHVGISHLMGLSSQTPVLDVVDGISIRRRDFDALKRRLGWDDSQIEAFTDDPGEWGAGSHVLYVECKQAKSPENTFLTDSYTPSKKAHSFLLALRLYKGGHVQIGRTFFARPAAFQLIPGGSRTLAVGPLVPLSGTEYVLEPDELPAARDLYHRLVRFDTTHRPVLRHLGIALDAFTSIYDRHWHRPQDRVIDASTAIEALVGGGEKQELTFKFAFRAASILADSDEERVRLFNAMKAYYAARSVIVHGGTPKGAAATILQDIEPLRSIVRRLLRAFLDLSESTTYRPTDSFYKHLDEMLIHTERRHELRKAAGLVGKRRLPE